MKKMAVVLELYALEIMKNIRENLLFAQNGTQKRSMLLRIGILDLLKIVYEKKSKSLKNSLSEPKILYDSIQNINLV